MYNLVCFYVQLMLEKLRFLELNSSETTLRDYKTCYIFL